MDSSEKLLRGDCKMSDLPTQRPRLIQVYLSSGFTDMRYEREVLTRDVFPELRKFCKNDHGLDLQILDIHWIERDLSCDPHYFKGICQHNAKAVTQSSVGPVLIALLGQKHGQLTIPTCLEQSELEKLRSALREDRHCKDAALLDEWYLLDENHIPPQYVLLPLESIKGGSKPQKWEKQLNKLHALFVRATWIDGYQGEFPELCQDLAATVIQQEIEAITHPNPSISARCLCYVRQFDDIRLHLNKTSAANFVDLEMKTRTIMGESYAAMSRVVDDVTYRVPSDNVLMQTISWKDPDGMKQHTHVDYLQNLKTHVLDNFKRLVNETHTVSPDESKILEEVLQHWHTSRGHLQGFHGQSSSLGAIREYILSDNTQLFVIHGPEGCGKTSVLAKAASETSGWLKEAGIEDSMITVRFCGSTIHSHCIRHLLYGLCYQIAHVVQEDPDDVPTNTKDLKSYFLSSLQNFPKTHLLVLYLDGLDLLDSREGAHNMGWLPVKLPANIKVIVSTDSTHHKVLQTLRSKITNKNNYCGVGTLPQSAALDVLATGLEREHRTLSKPQWEQVKTAISDTCSHLELSLIHSVVRKWTSFTKSNGHSINKRFHTMDFLKFFFDKLQEEFGDLPVSRVVAYLSAAPYGLSDMEMEDILSLDEKLLHHIYLRRTPFVRRCPPVLWVRIKAALSEQLQSHLADDVLVIRWRHPLLQRYATERYLNSQQTKLEIYSNLADFYTGKWSGDTTQPYKYDRFYIKKWRPDEEYGSARKYPAPQPIVYTSSDGKQHFNKRKLSQLPYYLAKSRRLTELKELVYFNYEWILSSLQAFDVYDLLDTFTLVEDDEVALVADALRLSDQVLLRTPEYLWRELTARLLTYYSIHLNIRSLIDQCDSVALALCPFIPHWHVLPSPGDLLQYEQQLDSAALMIESDGNVFLLSKMAGHCACKLWDIVANEPMPNIELLPDGEIFPSPDGKYLHMLTSENRLAIYDLSSTRKVGDIYLPYNPEGKTTLVVSNHYIAAFDPTFPSLCVLEVATRQVTFLTQDWSIGGIGISQDGNFAALTMENMLYFHELPDMECLASIRIPSQVVKQIHFSGDHCKFLLLDGDGRLYQITANLDKGVMSLNYIVFNNSIENFSVSHRETYLAVKLPCSLCMYACHVNGTDLMFTAELHKGRAIHRYAFSQDDQYLLAIQGMIFAIWEISSGNLIRCVPSPETQFTQIFSSDFANRAMTVTKNHVLLVWNLNNVENRINLDNKVVNEAIAHSAVASEGNTIVCGAYPSIKAKVVDMTTGARKHTLRHKGSASSPIENIIISPEGTYVATVRKNSKGDSPLLKEMSVWNTNTGLCSFTIPNVRHLVFGPEETIAVFRLQNWQDPELLSEMDPDTIEYLADFILEGREAEVPRGDIVRPPVFSNNGRVILLLLQRIEDEVKTVHLCSLDVADFYLQDDADILAIPGTEYRQLTDLRALDQYHIMLMYSSDPGAFRRWNDGSIDYTETPHEGYVICNTKRKSKVKNYTDTFITGESSNKPFVVQSCPGGPLILDDKLKVIDPFENYILYDLMAEGAPISWDGHLSNACFLEDGHYLALIPFERDCVRVHRCEDREVVAAYHAHGAVKSLRKGNNDRMVVVGYTDGRVVTFTFVLDYESVDRGQLNYSHSLEMMEENKTNTHRTEMDCDLQSFLTETDGSTSSRPTAATTARTEDRDGL